MELHERVQKALEVLDINKVAANFEVATSTVLRWASGSIANLHPLKQKSILRELAEMEDEISDLSRMVPLHEKETG